jgi:GNAT superfamily N-acetyltransferase
MDFLDLVVVDPSNRREGIATLLITHFRETSRTAERWTSTNESNQIMISLLRKLGWHESDHIEQLDLGDPELFFHTN